MKALVTVGKTAAGRAKDVVAITRGAIEAVRIRRAANMTNMISNEKNKKYGVILTYKLSGDVVFGPDWLDKSLGFKVFFYSIQT